MGQYSYSQLISLQKGDLRLNEVKRKHVLKAKNGLAVWICNAPSYLWTLIRLQDEFAL